MKILSLAALAVCGTAFAATPVWTLDKNAGAVSERFAAAGGRLPVSSEAQFEIPCGVIRDFNTFAITAKLRFNELADKTQLGLFNQISSDVGWSFSIMNYGRVGSPMTLNVNGVNFNVGWFRAKPGEVHTFTIAAKRGLVAAYMDGKVLKRCFTAVTPASVPIKVGWKCPGTLQEMKDVEILGLEIFGPEEEFFAKGEPREFAVGYKGGKGWMVEVPAKEHAGRPRLLFYGDSISSGYSGALKRMLADEADLYHWRHFVSSFKIDEKAFNDVATLAKYDMIVFNNGLHSVHWTPDKATDAQIEGVYHAMVSAFRKGAPQARLVWLSTTPHTARKDASGKVSSLGDLDPVVRRINRIAGKVMEEEGVDVIDGYGLLKDRLNLASGDQYHWKTPAYEMLAEAVARKFRSAVSDRGIRPLGRSRP